MQGYTSVDKLLMLKNEFVEALKNGNKTTAQIKLKDMSLLYKKITGRDLGEMFSESELEIIEETLGFDKLSPEKKVDVNKQEESEK